MDTQLAKAVAVLEKKRAALEMAHQAKMRELDDLIERLRHQGENGSDSAPLPKRTRANGRGRTSKTPHPRKGVPLTKPKRTRAPRGQVPRLILEALQAQNGEFTVFNVRAYLQKKRPEVSSRISAHRLSNEMHLAAKRHWIKRISQQKGGPNTYVTDQLPSEKQ